MKLGAGLFAHHRPIDHSSVHHRDAGCCPQLPGERPASSSVSLPMNLSPRRLRERAPQMFIILRSTSESPGVDFVLEWLPISRSTRRSGTRQLHIPFPCVSKLTLQAQPSPARQSNCVCSPARVTDSPYLGGDCLEVRQRKSAGKPTSSTRGIFRPRVVHCGIQHALHRRPRHRAPPPQMSL